MANLDNPRGFTPVGHLTGGEIRTNTYQMSASTTIYAGDLLQATANGTVKPAIAGADDTVIGVSAEYRVSDASTPTYINVYDDPNIIFSVQVSSGATPTSANVFELANHLAGAGSSATKLSGHELDGATISGTGAEQLKIIGIVDTPGNEWGEHVDVKVLINRHLYKATTGV